jgi:hypothetical protein
MSGKLLSEIKNSVKNRSIKVLSIRKHSKASEEYVDVEFAYPQKISWRGSLPYHYRRAGLFLQEAKDIADFITKAYLSLKPNKVNEWRKQERKLWKEKYSGKEVTKEFFNTLLNLKWNCVDCDFPKNPNWARRIQDIKEMGYLLSTYRGECHKCKKNTTHILLVPLDKTSATGYETWSLKLKNKIRVLPS